MIEDALLALLVYVIAVGGAWCGVFYSLSRLETWSEARKQHALAGPQCHCGDETVREIDGWLCVWCEEYVYPITISVNDGKALPAAAYPATGPAWRDQ